MRFVKILICLKSYTISRCATTGETGIQTTVSDCVAGTQPSEEPFKTEAVSTMRGCAVPRAMIRRKFGGSMAGKLTF